MRWSRICEVFLNTSRHEIQQANLQLGEIEVLFNFLDVTYLRRQDSLIQVKKHWHVTGLHECCCFYKYEISLLTSSCAGIRK